MENENKSPYEKLHDWYHAPHRTGYEWEALSLQQIADDAGVSTTAVKQHLYKIVREQLFHINSYKKFRERRKEHARQHRKPGHTLADKDIAEIQRLRKDHTIFETADITGFSPSTVQKYSAKKYKRTFPKNKKIY